MKCVFHEIKITLNDILFTGMGNPCYESQHGFFAQQNKSICNLYSEYYCSVLERARRERDYKYGIEVLKCSSQKLFLRS